MDNPEDSTESDFNLYSDPLNRMNYGDPVTRKRNRNLPDSLSVNYDIDSTGRNVSVQEMIEDYELGYEFEMSLDEYLEYRKKEIETNIWDSLLTRYDLKQALSGRDLARMLGQATGLSIPIPPNPVMSIFGKPEISLNVHGEVNLRMGWRWDSQNLGTVSQFGQTQSLPIFDMNVRVNLTGRIGDKLKLGTDWNTNRQFEYENKFKIGFEGEDDDIIKLLQVGNVSLPLSSTLISGGEALFGVRGDFQFGPLFLKAIASQKRGEKKYVSVKGGTSAQPFAIRAYDYAKNHFFLDTAYKEVYAKYFENSTPVIPTSYSHLRIKKIYVWESTNDVRNTEARTAKAHANLEPIFRNQGIKYDNSIRFASIKAGEVESGIFMILDTARYKFDANLGTLTIKNLRPDKYYAVSYIVEGASSKTDQDDEFYGDIPYKEKQTDTLVLKLVYRPNMQPGFKTLWSRQMKNIYSINATGVNTADTKIGIWYINKSNDSTDVLSGASDKLVTIMRVDQVNNSTGAAPSDGQFDLTYPFFDPLTGEITFPSLEPFRQGLIDYFTKQGTPQLADQYVFGEVYDTTYDVAKNNTARDRFIISGEVSGKATNRISLGAWNLAQGSVKVTLNGVALKEYEDYIVDYYSGTVTIRNQRATLPNANLNIEYESNDVFNISTRTLVGLRADYLLHKSRRLDAVIGGTWMMYDQSIIQDRVRLGDEPVSNMMFDLDGKVNWDTPWLTRMIDLLPFYDTKANSSISLNGEVALKLPEPNKRESEIAEDNGEAVVYIDDFEAAHRYITLGLSPSQWYHSSPPADTLLFGNMADTLKRDLRGRLFWFQKFRPDVPINDVYPNKSTQQGRRLLSPLRVNFDPAIRGIYNMNRDFVDSLNPDYDADQHALFVEEKKDTIWGGMMRLFSAFNTNFDTENIEYIEVMMKIEAWDPDNTKMYIDLGQISEDVIPNDYLNTEDGIAENNLPNNLIDEGEDVGIDMIDNAIEKVEYPAPLNKETDPARDDYSFDFTKDDSDREDVDFIHYNAYEGNSKVSELGQFPDTEILNANNGQTLSDLDSYFSYEVDLSPYPTTNTQIVGGPGDGGINKWYLYRIPIRKPTRKVGDPLFSNIQYLRVWFKGGLMKAQIADWRLVGSHWQRISNVSSVASDDSVLQVSFVNREENDGAPDYYTMPPGVEPPRQITSSAYDEDIRLNEQSIAISVTNLKHGEERMAARFFNSLDLFYYEKMKFFIHGDGSMPNSIVSGATAKAYAFLRFGIDSSNYYEFRTPLVRGWQSKAIDLADLTAIKRLRDEEREEDRQVFPVEAGSLDTFAIKGNPILTRVEYFGLGIFNPGSNFGAGHELSTTMWFNELRLLNPESSADWAAVGSLNIKGADLFTINANASYKKANFSKLEDSFGDRINTTNWSFTTTANLDKLIASKGTKIPVSYTHSENVQDPEFEANNDISLDAVVDAAVADARRQAEEMGVEFTDDDAKAIEKETRAPSQTVLIQDSWALTGVKLGLPTNYWLIRETLNQLTFDYSYSQQYERSPVVSQRFNWIWKFGTKYNVNISDIATVQPLGWAKDIPILGDYHKLKINFLPNNFSASLNMQRSRQTEKSRLLDYASPVVRDFSTQRQANFTWRMFENGFLNPSLNYMVSTNSTLVPYEMYQLDDGTFQQRTGSELASKILFTDGKIIDFGRNNLHNQTVNLSLKPKLPLGKYQKYVELSGSFNTTYNWQDPMQSDPLIADVAKSASFANTIKFGTTIKLQALTEELGSGSKLPKPMRRPDPEGKPSSKNVFDYALDVLQFVFLDYEKFKIDFTQNNNASNPGVYGATGFNNFWSFGGSTLANGPSMAYQLGLVSHPHGGFNFVGSDKFPYFTTETYPGLRPPNAVLQDNFGQRTKLDMNTSRPLWEGATLDLNWGSELAWNENYTVETDADGNPTFTNLMATQSYNRTNLTLPSIFGINLFDNNVDNVLADFKTRRDGIIARYGGDADNVYMNQEILNALSESFHDGMQAFSFFSGDIAKFLPAMNWRINWQGIEKWGLWGGIAEKISIEHAYVSRYIESASITDDGKTIESQQIQYGFQPLIGLSMGFDEDELDGTLTATLRYVTTNAYQLSASNMATLSRQASDELQIQASYAMKGFSFPLLGIDLENDIEFSFMASYKANRRSTYNVALAEEEENVDTDELNDADGNTLDGNTQIIIEPRVRYTMSNIIVSSFFIKYEGTFTEGAAQPGFTTTQFGLDLKINLSGGR